MSDSRQQNTAEPAKPRAGMSLEEETQLVADVLLADRKAIADFVHQFSDMVFGFIGKRIDNQSVVEDLCQDVFLAAWAQLSSFQFKSSLKTWLCAIAQNKVSDFYRRQIHELPFEDDCDELEIFSPEAPWISIEQSLDRRILEKQIQLTMLELPEGYRAILRWRYWDQKSLSDVALQTGKTIKSVERLLARARTQFAAKWKEGRHGN